MEMCGWIFGDELTRRTGEKFEWKKDAVVGILSSRTPQDVNIFGARRSDRRVILSAEGAEGGEVFASRTLFEMTGFFIVS